eukprot:1179751-Alexandrium_andersonii.AAC.1
MAVQPHAWPPRLLQATPTYAPHAPPFRCEPLHRPFRRSEAAPKTISAARGSTQVSRERKGIVAPSGARG